MAKNGSSRTANPCLEAALAYATDSQRQLHVFPAKPGEKKSRLSRQYAGVDGKNWGMSNSPATITKNWKQFPDASNVCIVTGSINSLFVIETDTKEAHPNLAADGEDSFKKLFADHNEEWPPKTLTAKTPSGGKHYVYNYPDGDVVIINSDGKLGSKLIPGVDVRGENGMIVAPPSFNPKYNAYYEWISPKQQGISDAPAWLIDLVAQKPIDHKVGEPQADIAKIKQAMEYIPNDKPDMAWEVSDYKTGAVNTRAGWEGWNSVMMALYRATGGSDEGFAIALEWCRKNKTKFNEKYTHHTWHRRYRTSPPKSLGAGTLFAVAETYSPGWQKIYDEEAITSAFKAAPRDETIDSGPEPDAPDSAPMLSEDYLALQFTKAHAGTLRYVAAWGKWLIYDGTKWTVDEKLKAFTMARQICRTAAKPINRKKEAKTIASAKTRSAVVSLASADPCHAASVDQWDKDPWLLNTPDGVIDLRTGNRRDHRATDYMMKMTAVTPDINCPIPLWRAFLKRITNNAAKNLPDQRDTEPPFYRQPPPRTLQPLPHQITT
jgi:putative DNA primase/helicase